MKLLRMFSPSRSSDSEAQRIIQEEIAFVLEQDEQRFTRQLLTHLLDEGCNLPLIIAKPRFYELMVTGIFPQLPPAGQKTYTDTFGKLDNQRLCHQDFLTIMSFYQTRLKVPGKTIAFEVIKALETLKKEWQLDEAMFQEDGNQFLARLQALIDTLGFGAQDVSCQNQQPGSTIPLSLVRRRLYIAMTTGLLRHFKERKSFQTEFGSIPHAVRGMQTTHEEFCRLMRFSQERLPYFQHIASQIFWRTLETLRLEMSKS